MEDFNKAASGYAIQPITSEILMKIKYPELKTMAERFMTRDHGHDDDDDLSGTAASTVVSTQVPVRKPLQPPLPLSHPL